MWLHTAYAASASLPSNPCLSPLELLLFFYRGYNSDISGFCGSLESVAMYFDRVCTVQYYAEQRLYATTLPNPQRLLTCHLI